MIRSTRALCVAALTLLVSATASAAGYRLAPADASVNFISTKAGTVAEIHRFAKVAGKLGEDGGLRLAIDLASVDTAIEVRNERMRDMLFEIADFPEAIIRADLDPALWDGLAAGERKSLEVAGALALHGEEGKIRLVVDVVGAADGGLIVTSRLPVIVNAGQYALGEGVERLRAIAGLPAISPAVPVTFALHFRPEH
ncbi:MAG: YceI family protein [Pseudomonadota bacterium]